MKRTGRSRLFSMLMAVVMVLGAMPANAVMAEEDEIVVISEEPENTVAEGADSAEAFSDYAEPVETIEPEYPEPAGVEVYEPDYQEPVEVEVYEPADYAESAEDPKSYGDPAGEDTVGEVYIEDGGIVIESIETVEEEDIPVIEETDIAETETENEYGIMTLASNVAQIGSTKYSSVQAAINAAGSTASTVTMLDDSTEEIEIKSGQNITLDLNGHTLSVDWEPGTSVTTITVDENGTLNLKDSNGSGKVAAGFADYGGAVHNEGNLTLSGGSIVGNKFGNWSSYGSQGGGVYNSGIFTMSDGVISGNYGSQGGGVYNIGTFDMSGGTISGNNSGVRGAGVYVDGGTFTMTGGEINGNESNYWAGGIYINNGTFAMTGGEISGNKNDYQYGGGIYMIGGTFKVSGTPVITGNSSSNVYLTSGTYITLDGELTEGASIGVTTTTAPSSSTSVQVTRAESDTKYYKKSANYFFYDKDTTKIGFPNDSKQYVEFNGTAAASLTTESYGTVKYTSTQKAIDVAETEAGTVALLTDCTENITIGSDQNIVLDLSGYTLSKSGTVDSPVIENNGTLTLQDSGGSGMIKSGYVSNAGIFTMNSGTIGSSIASETGGGVYNTSEFTMTGGEISGNMASGSGGGVYNAGLFTMTGGEISGNTAGETGGGVYNTGEFTMMGGEISGNTAGSYGGGVYTDSGIFTMTGGTIIDNVVGKYYGDGVYVAGGTFNLSGTPVVAGNMDSNVYLPEEIYITLTGELRTGASVSVTTANAPSVDTPVQITTAEDTTEYYLSSAQYFFNGKDETKVGHANSEGKYVEIFGAEVGNVASLTTTGGDVSEYETVQDAFDSAGIGDMVALLTDVSENVAIAEGQDIILDLNGYTLSGVASAEIPAVENSGTLTLQNSGSSGRIKGGVSTQGGGVYNTGTFTMESGTISGNEADYGGGVYNIGTFAMTGGTINMNEAGYGGGVYNTGTFTITGGTINANEADYGGGVYNTGTFSMTGGTISGNTAYTFGGGVYADSGTFNLSGTPVITNNSASNVYLPNGIYITLSGELTEGASVGVTTYKAPTSSTGVQVTTVESDTEYYETSAQYFIYDGNNSYTGLAFSYGKFVAFGSNNFVALLTSEYTSGMGFNTVQDAVNAAGTTPGTVTMLANSTENITIASGQDLTLDLNGYTLSGYGTAVHTVVTINGTLTLKDSVGTGKITKGNKSQGGGVYTSGNFIMENGTISGNTALSYGAGVYVNYGTFTMNGGEISGNSADLRGGGVYVNSGTFTMEGGEISGNSASNYGGGVYVNGGTFKVSGTPVITGNSGSNVYLPKGMYITLDGKLTEGASIGVTTATAPSSSTSVQVTKAESDTEYYKKSANYFFYDKDTTKIGFPNDSKRYVEFSGTAVASLTTESDGTLKYTSVQKAIDAAETAAGTVALLTDCTENITIGSDQNIVLDLSGYTLSKSGTADSPVIDNSGNLTLQDSGTSGMIKGGYVSNAGTFTMNSGTIGSSTASESGGGVYNTGEFTMTGGAISGNIASGSGGGVYNAGAFTMTGGEISGNTAGESGGGVYNTGEFTMTGGEISENTASSYGGGVYTDSGIFAMTGGTINDNAVGKYYGDGVYVAGGIFSLSGTPVVAGNMDSNVYLPEGIYITLTGELKSGASVSVTTANAPSVDTPVQITTAEDTTEYYLSSAQYFFNGKDETNVGHANSEGKYVEIFGTELVNVASLTTTDGNVSEYETVQAAFDVAGIGDMVALLTDASENVAIAEDQDIILDLNGYTLSGIASAAVPVVENSGTLTLQNSGSSGRINGGVSSQGGGVYNTGTFTMKSGTISGNEADYGGGVYNIGTFAMTGGTINANEADYGGGVYNTGTFTMTGGTISGNTVYTLGGGVYADSGIFNVSGTPVITNNSASNVYLPKGIYITLSGELTEGASVGVTTYSTPTSSTGVQVTTVESDTEYYETSAQYFIYDGNSSYTGLAFSYGKFVVFGSTNFVALLTSEYTNGMGFSTVQDAVDAAGTTPGTVTMLAKSTENITIASGQDITLDLNGCTLSGYGGTGGSAVRTVVTINGSGSLTLEDSAGTGKITNGRQPLGAGVYTSGTFTMKGGRISGNEAISDGGGVYVNNGTFTMEGGEISGNTADHDGGGGVYVNGGTFNMIDGLISDNTSGWKGGGVYVKGGTFNMTGGSISSNKVEIIYDDTYSGGGGVCIYGGTFTMSGGKISDNSVTNVSNSVDGGGGVYFCKGTFELFGNPVITNNTEDGVSNNVFLYPDRTITLDGYLTEGTSIGVSTYEIPIKDSPVQITEAESGTEYYKTSASYFFYDMDTNIVGTANEENCYVEFCSNYVASLTDTSGVSTLYDTVQSAIDAAGSSEGLVTLLTDCCEDITVQNGRDITLDLSGYSLSGTGSGSVVSNLGILILTDSGSSGIISGGSASDGGGVYNKGTLTMNAGTIGENEASGNGGGVYNTGSFTMSGGAVSGNKSQYGSGVYNLEGAEFTMNTGTISENEASGDGGGVYNTGTFTMSDGTITENKAGSAGGAVYDSGIFNLSGEPFITGNTVNDKPNNVYLPSGLYINLLGELEEEAVIGVTTEEVPSEETPVQITLAEDGTQYYAASAQCFVYDGDSDCKGHANDEKGYVELAGILYLAELTVDDETFLFTSVQDAIDEAGDSKGTVVMLALSSENVVIEAEQDITLDLAGFTLRGGQHDSTITNYGSLSLTDSSYEKTGMITRGSATNGGGVYNEGTFILDEGTLSGNAASSMGGGVYNAGTFTMNGGTISSNTSQCGSGVYNADGALFTLKDGLIDGNEGTSNGLGGGIYNEGTFIMDKGTISANTVSSMGGGIYNAGIFTMNDGAISSNTSQYGSGAYNTDGAVFTMIDGLISGNEGSSNSMGGGVYNEGTFILDEGDGTISGNTAVNMGGGVYNSASFTMNGGVITENKQTSSSDGGGGVYNAGIFTMTDGTISSNTSTRGAGVYNLGGASFTMKDGLISANGESSSSGLGGGIYNNGDAEFVMEGGTFTGNKANYGGGVYNNNNGIFTMTGGTIENNSATYGGGVNLNQGDGSFTMTGGTISNNTASNRGGGLNCEGTVEFILSGLPVICDNTVSGSSDNVYLPSGQYITLGGELDDSAEIGVKLENGMGAVTTEETDTTYYSASVEYFNSDAGYPVTTSDYNKCVTLGYEITYEANDGSGTSATVYYQDEEPTIGYYFSTQSGFCITAWNTEADGSGTEYEDGCTVHLSGSMVLYALWAEHDFSEDGFCKNCGFYEPAVWDGDAYEIGNLGQFYWFVSLVNSDKKLAEFTSDDTGRGASANGALTADIGSEENPVTKNVTSAYKGSFDGQFHTITLDLDGGTSENTALFAITNGASICNLFTAGTISAGGKFAAGIVSEVDGNFTMKKCVSSVDIISSVDGDGTHGGLVANLTDGSNFTIEDCAFTGSITGEYTIKCGGIVGWANGNANGTARNCWTTGTFELSGDDTDSANIIRNGDSKYSNCYYLNPIRSGSEQGIQKDADAFASGEVPWLLNGGSMDGDDIASEATTDGTQAWYQNLDNGETPDGTPVLFTDHGTVYYGYPCNGTERIYSNSPLQSEQNQPHELTEHAAEEPSCEEDGNIACYVCTVCGKWFSDETCTTELKEEEVVRPALGHNYSLEKDADGEYLYVTFTWPEENNDKEHLNDITCTATFTCKDCNHTETADCEVTHVESNDHAASCTEPDDYDVRANATITNPRDGSELTAVEDEIIYGVKLGHDWPETAVFDWNDDWTECIVSITCARCEETLTEELSTGNGITDEITTEADCTTDEVITYTAEITFMDEDAAEESQDVGPFTDAVDMTQTGTALGHLYSEDAVTFNWVENADGSYSCESAIFTCVADGCGYTETVEAVVTEENITPAVCEEAGETVYTASAGIASRDGTVTASETKSAALPEATGHDYDYENAEYEWTETDDGWACTATAFCLNDAQHTDTRTCTVSHETTEEATCGVEGVETYTASFTVDDKTYTCAGTQTKSIPATGQHEWSWEEKEEQDGDTTITTVIFTCSSCGDTVEDDIVVGATSGGIEVHTDLAWEELLSADDLAALFEMYDDDEEIDITLDIAAMSEGEVPEDDTELINEAVASMWNRSELFYMDISLSLTVVHNNETVSDETIAETNQPITFTVTIPEELLEAEGDSYAVIRIHEGGADILPATDNGDGTLTFSSDRFSTYAIAKGYMYYDVNAEINSGETISKAYDGGPLELEAGVTIDPELDDAAYTYQWYRDGELIEGATDAVLILSGEDVSVQESVYTCEINVVSEAYTETVQAGITVTITRADNSLAITTESLDKTYDGSAVEDPEVTADLGESTAAFTWYEVDEDGEIIAELDQAPSDAGTYKVVASVPETENYAGASAELTFTITPQEICSP